MKKVLLLGVMGLMLQSCYTTKFTVGEGAQNHKSETYKQHHFVYGLASIQNKDAQQHIEEAENCDVQIQHSFVDKLIGSLTGGLYSPVTIKVKE